MTASPCGPDDQRTARIAHDLKNRLTAILGFCDLVLADDRGDVSADLGAIRDHAEKAAVLVRRLLAPAAEGVEASAAEVHVVQALRALETTLRRRLGPDVRFRLETDGTGDPVIAMQPERFDQVILNLVDNAADATPAGGAITVRVRRPEEGDPAKGQQVHIDVTDTGSGISQALLARVFEPFVTGKPPDRGTGLGLAIVRDTVEAAGGSVGITSAPGAGTTVSLRFVRAGGAGRPSQATAAHPALPDEMPGEPAAGSTVRVLLVDDEAAARTVAARALLRAGCQVVEAGDGEEALRHLEATARGPGNGVDVVVSDVAMPGLDGRELADLVGRRYPGIALVLTSGYEATATGCAAAGIRFLAKPFRLRDLVRMVEEAAASTPRLARNAGRRDRG